MPQNSKRKRNSPAAAADPTPDELERWQSASELRQQFRPDTDDWFWHVRVAIAELSDNKAPGPIAALQVMWAIVGGVHRHEEMLGGDLVAPLPVDQDWLNPGPANGQTDENDPFAGRDPHALVPVPYWAVVQLGAIWGTLLHWKDDAGDFDLNREFGARTGGRQGERGYVPRTIVTAQRRRVAAEVEKLIYGPDGMTATKAYQVVAERVARAASWVKAAHLAEREWVRKPERFGDSASG